MLRPPVFALSPLGPKVSLGSIAPGATCSVKVSEAWRPVLVTNGAEESGVYVRFLDSPTWEILARETTAVQLSPADSRIDLVGGAVRFGCGALTLALFLVLALGVYALGAWVWGLL